MNDTENWSANIGRWMGVRVSVHVLLLLAIAGIFGVQWQVERVTGQELLATAMVTTAVFLLSILIHEIAHVFTLVSLGGLPERIVLTPWGGSSRWYLPTEPLARLMVFMAGPFVNAALFLIASAILLQSGASDLQGLMDPFHPHQFTMGIGSVGLLKIAAWVNFQLLLVNLIPCFPFDGVQIVRCLLEMLELDDSRIRSESAIMVLGHAVALALVGMAWLAFDREASVIGPVWLIFLTGGITLYFCGRYSFDRETRDAVADQNESGTPDWDFDPYLNESSFFGEDAGDMLDDTMDGESITSSQWMLEKQQSRAQQQQERETIEEQLADEVLEKLHLSGGGLSVLSNEERTLLDRVSRRLRERREKSAMQQE